jgi:hypothetical protein
MFHFILDAIFWTLAIYGAIEVVGTLYCIFIKNKITKEKVHIIIVTKNQEEAIEGVVHMLDNTDINYENILVADVGSTDETTRIAEIMSENSDLVKFMSWNDCKEYIDDLYS